MKRLLLILLTPLLIHVQSRGQTNATPEDIQKVKVAGHAHMDPVYRWRWNEIENREIYNTFSNVLKMMDKYPDLKFSQSSLLYYSSIQQRFPALFEKVKQSIEDGRWSVVGGQWVETDESMPSGETPIKCALFCLRPRFAEAMRRQSGKGSRIGIESLGKGLTTNDLD